MWRTSCCSGRRSRGGRRVPQNPTSAETEGEHAEASRKRSKNEDDLVYNVETSAVKPGCRNHRGQWRMCCCRSTTPSFPSTMKNKTTDARSADGRTRCPRMGVGHHWAATVVLKDLACLGYRRVIPKSDQTLEAACGRQPRKRRSGTRCAVAPRTSKDVESGVWSWQRA